MDADAIAWLRTAEGVTAAAAATDLLRSHGALYARRHLERQYGGAHARDAIALAEGRSVAAEKYADAAHLYCDRTAAEQASHEAVARLTALRFAGAARVADLGCGMGGDTLAIAEHAPVLAVDRDTSRLAMTEANVAARGLAARVTTACADLTTWIAPPGIDAIWIDPARRDGSMRRLDPEHWSPPLAAALALASGVARAGVKVAPGIALDALPVSTEIEFISRAHALAAAVCWLGSTVTASRRATIIDAMGAPHTIAVADGLPAVGDAFTGYAAQGEPGAYLYDPDPAIGRARLVEQLAGLIGAWQLDAQIAYLSADDARETPFARRYRVRTWFPFAERTLRDAVRDAGYARVEVMRRGSPVETNTLERRLNGALAGGSGSVGTVVLTRCSGRHIALVCERDRDG